MKKIALIGIIIASVIIVIKIAAPKKEKSQLNTRGGMIIQASIGDATYLNPVLYTDSASGDICDLVFNGLLKYDKDLKLVGDLAESFEISNDKLQIVFKLRKNVKWHDGADFTAKDVKFTYDAIMDPNTRTARSSRFDRVKSVETPDLHTVVVTYKEVYAPALESWGIGIIPKHLYELTDINKNQHNRNPIGTGPYRFVSWRTDDRIVLEANSEYFEGEPGIKRVVYKIIPDQAVQFLELKKGTIDWMNPTPDQWKNETTNEAFLREFNRFKYPSFAYSYLAFNLRNEMFSDVRVRKAISLAIDKQKMIDSVLQGLGSIATGPYPPQSWAYNEEVKDYGFNIKKAKKLMKEAGWVVNKKTGILEKNGVPFSFTLMTNQGNNTRKLSCEIVQDQLKQIGMDVKVRIQEWSSFIHQYVDKRQFEAILLGWSLAIDPDQFSIWHSSQQEEGQFNFIGYSNTEIDELLVEGISHYDIRIREKIYQKLHKILHDELPYVFLFVQDARHAIQIRVKNIKVEAGGIGHNFIKWYIPEQLRKY